MHKAPAVMQAVAFSCAGCGKCGGALPAAGTGVKEDRAQRYFVYQCGHTTTAPTPGSGRRSRHWRRGRSNPTRGTGIGGTGLSELLPKGHCPKTLQDPLSTHERRPLGDPVAPPPIIAKPAAPHEAEVTVDVFESMQAPPQPIPFVLERCTIPLESHRAI